MEKQNTNYAMGLIVNITKLIDYETHMIEFKRKQVINIIFDHVRFPA